MKKPNRDYNDDTGDDADVLQAALAAAQLTVGSQEDTNSNEVLYNQGATPLYAAIEETRWSDALELLEMVPEQARAWVKSTGTEKTTFGWSLWKRLPIHEACRRQAPAWMIAALLRAYPESVAAVTQFGELPLHCAVECAATPEVVNLLLVNHCEGILTPDTSGRTPLQIVAKEDTDIDTEDQFHIQNSLKSAHDYLIASNSRWENKIESMKVQYEDVMRRKEMVYHDNIRVERDVQVQLEKKLAQMKGHVVQVSDERNSLEQSLSKHHVQKEEWQEVLEKKEETLDEVKLILKKEREESCHLRAVINSRDSLVESLRNRVAILEDDLIKITLLQRDSIGEASRQADEVIQAMLESQQILQGQLEGQTKGLEMLIEQRGLELPSVKKVEEKEEVLEDNEPLDKLAFQTAEAAADAILKAENERALTEYENAVYVEVTKSVSIQEVNNGENEEKKE
mmetsp:Transcript_8792/g.9726  ORF Transcript_8792/g.9726 Transcript_8792/m.9726 type:complete len:455 (+) Transcript_8792:22-1386(+)